MPSIFSKIVKGEIPSFKVAENEEFYAFLDIRPLAKGHTLVIPKKEIDYFFDIEDDLYSRYMIFVKKVARAVDSVIECQRVGVAIVGLEVAHAHVHLIPLNGIYDIDFSREPVKLSQEEYSAIAADIYSAFKAGND